MLSDVSVNPENCTGFLCWAHTVGAGMHSHKAITINPVPNPVGFLVRHPNHFLFKCNIRLGIQ